MTCERHALNPQQTADARANADDKLLADSVVASVQKTANNFDAIDKDHNGFLDLGEINNMADKGASRALAKSYDNIQSLNDDEWFFENDGITRGDLQKFKEHAAAMPGIMAQARDVRETMQRNWDQIKGSDERIRRGELSAAANSGKFDKCDTDALQAAEDDFSGIGHKVGKSSRKIKYPHLEERVGEKAAWFADVKQFGKNLD